jgi:hypothetical protein
MLKDGDQFSDDDDEIQFEELHRLYTTNHLVIKEFANYINDFLIFESENPREKRPIKNFSKEEFERLMSIDKLNYLILKPEEMRLKFTEFVMMNQPLALDEAAASLLQSEKFNFSKFLFNIFLIICAYR